MPPNKHETNTIIYAPIRREFNATIEAASTRIAPWLTDQLDNIDAVRDALYSDGGTTATIWRDENADYPCVVITRDAEHAVTVAEHDACTYAVLPDRDALAPRDIARVGSHGTHTHFTSEHVTLHSTGDGYTRDALTAFTARRDEPEPTSDDGDRDATLGIEWRGGRPPIGCTSRAGQLQRADNYDDVRRVLQLVADGAMTPGEAAVELDCTRKTIESALQRAELYKLDR